MNGESQTGTLAGKVAIVTGAGSGIGRAIAELYAERGAAVIVSDRAEEAGRDVVAGITRSGAHASFVQADVSQPEQCRDLVAVAMSQHGRLDIACNNAGVGGAAQLVGEYDDEEWNRVIAINLSGVF